MYQTLITASELAQKLSAPDWAIVDCRFSLGDSERGRSDYVQAHIPGAVYAHLNEDLSGPIAPGKTGRHPLPSIETFAQVLSNWGIDGSVQVVAYDESDGSMAAARLWWMLRWMGHEAAAVLDGGWRQWQKAGYPVAAGVERRAPRAFIPQVRGELAVSADAVLANLRDPNARLLDVRSGERYRGEKEPIDPVAGHIPGAINAPFADMLGDDGRFLSPEALRARFQALLGGVPPEQAIFYCGSGVTSAHELLALAHAGLGDGRLYAGSWSEWITDPHRPTATGAT
ncbi:MAG TPA: sulfurtransferase [Ktedonobacterales bacterium]|jgi:thiosulfate/3-mercaptopyruvate sulfurtransferase